ncbi:MAG: GMC family oxidoreductase N-terminal domain-containing protein [Actinomycetota bacterium]|nr:GMC family oxidoreductase N-terminal domain-containing protein [Actinomycetota bacterium]
MSEAADFVVVGGGSAGAVVAARLSEDPTTRVILIEAGGRPPAAELMPAASPALQVNPDTDWMFTADAGGCGLGLVGGRMMVPRGKMLGGSSGINYLAYVRGHPGDFDAWAAGGATGWSYDEVLPYFRKSEGLVASTDLPIDAEAHGTDGPLGVAVRSPVLPGARAFVHAAVAAGIPHGDYNGRDRGGPAGLVSLLQTTTLEGKRSSTYHAFLEGKVESRPNLMVITNAHVTRIVIEGEPGELRATGVEYVDNDGTTQSVSAGTEVIVSAGAIGSPHLLMLSGVGPRAHLESLGISCLVDAPDVGQHLKDHLQLGLMFSAPGLGVSMASMGVAMGPDALRAPAGPLPGDPADDASLPPELSGLKAEAERQLGEWFTTGRGLASSSLYDASAWLSTGLGDQHTHDAQIGLFACGYNADIWQGVLRVDTDTYFVDPATTLGPQAESMIALANPVQPHSEGEIRLASADPRAAPDIRMNYYGDPHDMAVMIEVVRRTLSVVEKLRDEHEIGAVHVPPALAAKHEHTPGDTLSDELIEDFARHFSFTVYHPTSTCRIGSVVDPQLRVGGVNALRVADASVMPNVVSGNTNAATIMIGEKAAETIALEHGLELTRFVGKPA